MICILRLRRKKGSPLAHWRHGRIDWPVLITSLKMHLRCIFDDLWLAVAGDIASAYLDYRDIHRYTIHIQFISRYEGGLISAWQYSIKCAFLYLHLYVTCLICATWEENNWTGSLETCSVETMSSRVVKYTARPSADYNLHLPCPFGICKAFLERHLQRGSRMTEYCLITQILIF